jgi:hypothetical protein
MFDRRALFGSALGGLLALPGLARSVRTAQAEPTTPRLRPSPGSPPTIFRADAETPRLIASYRRARRALDRACVALDDAKEPHEADAAQERIDRLATETGDLREALVSAIMTANGLDAETDYLDGGPPAWRPCGVRHDQRVYWVSPDTEGNPLNSSMAVIDQSDSGCTDDCGLASIFGAGGRLGWG